MALATTGERWSLDTSHDSGWPVIRLDVNSSKRSEFFLEMDLNDQFCKITGTRQISKKIQTM